MSLQDELNAIPGVHARRDDATRQFVFNHTMLRVKDVAKSLDFYTRVLGFTLVRRRDFAEAKFSLYFLVLVDDPAQIPAQEPARGEWLLSQRGVLELTHNHGSEDDASVRSTTTATASRAASAISACRCRTSRRRARASSSWASPSRSA